MRVETSLSQTPATIASVSSATKNKIVSGALGNESTRCDLIHFPSMREYSLHCSSCTVGSQSALHQALRLVCSADRTHGQHRGNHVHHVPVVQDRKSTRL